MGTLCFFFILTLTTSTFAAIYGTDDRLNILEVPQFQSIARSVAIAIPNNFLSKHENGSWEVLDVEHLGMSTQVYACMSERFATEPIIGNCTGFLVGPRTLLTAGHCVLPKGIVDNDENHPFCKAFTWVFDFNVKEGGKTQESNFPAKNVYGCKKIIRAENTEADGDFGNDFAIIELDRDVDASIGLQKLSSQAPIKGASAFAIGHPSGLPAKYSGTSSILKTNHKHYFEINLDSQAGNSGSPVFNLKQEVIGILVSGHNIDYYQSAEGCYKANVCDATGKNCIENSPFPHLQVSNYIQRLDQILPYLKN